MNWFQKHKTISAVLGIIVLLLAILIIIAFGPHAVEPTVTSNPAESYAEAFARIQEIKTAESQLENLNATCVTRLLTHGEKTEKTIVFLHGFTSCPEQFEQLGEKFHDRGYNVYIPRMPGHGLEDRLGSGLETLTAESLANFATQTADIAQGLGEHVTIAGLSGGGSVTVWLAQEREDVDLAVPIAPFVGVGFIPASINRPFANLLITAPDFFQWWDPINKEHNPLSSAYQYVRYPSHALADFLELGYAVKDDARNSPPAAGSILVITNAGDESINQAVVSEFVDAWRNHGHAVETYQFSRELNQPHDIITPDRPDNNISLTYPKLIELLGAPAEPLPNDSPSLEDGKPADGESSDEIDPDSQTLTNQPWGWVSFTDPLQQFSISDPENYVMEFSDYGTLQVKADCNTAQGKYTTDGSSLTIELGPMTLAACPAGSRSDEMLQKLNFVALYFFQDDHLFIDMFADGGTFEFIPLLSE
jgi:esterase/lipase